jgi:flagellar motor switch protein FliM
MNSCIASDDPMFHVRFEVTWDDRVSSINLCYPAPSLAAGLAQLQTRA